LKTRAASHWYGRDPVPVDEPILDDEPVEVGAAARKKAWARLLAKIYDVDPFRCLNAAGRWS